MQSTTTAPLSSPASVVPSNDTLDDTAILEDVRKAARQLGKDAATHRFTAAEKQQLADIVYTYTRQGLRTSENEITRIAVNWLLLDYRRHGDLSILAKLIHSLHE